MKKLYNNNKGKIHPSTPAPPSTAAVAAHLSFLPVALATLAAALEPEDQEVLAYLISSSGTTNTNKKKNNFSGDSKPTTKSAGGGQSSGGDHPPRFDCNCFRCYTSYWVRWDASPNQQLIHEIIDAFEDGPIYEYKNNRKNKKERKKNRVSSTASPHAPPSGVEKTTHAPPELEENSSGDDYDEDDDQDGVCSEKGAIRKFVSFIGERIWGFLGI